MKVEEKSNWEPTKEQLDYSWKHVRKQIREMSIEAEAECRRKAERDRRKAESRIKEKNNYTNKIKKLKPLRDQSIARWGDNEGGHLTNNEILISNHTSMSFS